MLSLWFSKYFADKGLAPKIKSYEEFLGGWKEVVMEKVEGLWTPCPKGLLEGLTKDMHAEGFVHGDLHQQNILHSNGNVFILDFDWAGERGVSRYLSIGHKYGV